MRRDERGATLILAMAFMIVLGAIGTTMMSSLASALHSRKSLGDARAREYAADSAIQDAITKVRQLSAPGPALTGCVPGTSYKYTAADGNEIRVNCYNRPQVTRSGFQQRNVIFNACKWGGADCTDSSSIIRAQVNFQSGTGGAITRTWVQSWSVNA